MKLLKKEEREKEMDTLKPDESTVKPIFCLQRCVKKKGRITGDKLKKHDRTVCINQTSFTSKESQQKA